MNNWYSKEVSEIYLNLSSKSLGLSNNEAKERLGRFGYNLIPEGKRDSLFVLFIKQFQSPLIYILFASAILLLAMGDLVDALLIGIVLLINAIVGVFQEGRSENAMATLSKFTETDTTVIREGVEIIIPDKEVVPGDIVFIREGDKVPADARLISVSGLKASEAALTGESEPVLKSVEVIKKNNLSPSDQLNMLFKGTTIVSGSASALVVSTGISTIIGKISERMKKVSVDVPLKREIASLSKIIVIFVLILSISLFFIGLLMGNSVKEMFAIVVSLAVSVVPEGLPVVLTLVLALGVVRMSKRNALVKKLQAVESLGQTKVIAVDKTGTLTKNEMIIERVYVGGEEIYDISGSGYEPKGKIFKNGKEINITDYPGLLLSAQIAAYCTNARAVYSEESKIWKVYGDPTEAAMNVFAEKLGFKKTEIENNQPMIAEIPFDYNTKYHATIHKKDGERILTVVGAPERVMELCSTYYKNGELTKFDEKARGEVKQVFEKMTSEGYRVIAYSYTKEPPESLLSENLKELEFVGFFGMRDGLRPEVPDALLRSQNAGIRVVMITGDNKNTALAIARDAGIWKKGDKVMTGSEVEELDDKSLAPLLDNVSVFARVTPEHKLRIIEAFRARGEIVAMTGDGVNDAPSLMAADLGVAMGRIGTDVAKEAADIVLLDDNFGSIVAAVEEGRSIYQTIKKVLLYLFSTNLSEVIVITITLLVTLPLPLNPAQIIWLNLVTDVFMVLALVYDPKNPGLLSKYFRSGAKKLVDSDLIFRMILMSLTMALGALYLFKSNLSGGDIARASTIVLTSLAVGQWFNAWNCRNEIRSIFSSNPFNNKYLIVAFLFVFILQLWVVYNPFMQKIFGTSALSLKDWIYIIPISLVVILVEEIRKFVVRIMSRV